jgi:hypothetical protein
MGRYIILADLFSIKNENCPGRLACDSGVDDDNVRRLEIPDEAGKALWRLPGVEDLKTREREFP